MTLLLIIVIYRVQDPDPAIFCLDPAGYQFEKKIRIRFRPDINFNGSGSGRILAEFWPDPDPVSLEKLCFPPSAFFSLI